MEQNRRERSAHSAGKCKSGETETLSFFFKSNADAGQKGYYETSGRGGERAGQRWKRKEGGAERGRLLHCSISSVSKSLSLRLCICLAFSLATGLLSQQ